MATMLVISLPTTSSTGPIAAAIPANMTMVWRVSGSRFASPSPSCLMNSLTLSTIGTSRAPNCSIESPSVFMADLILPRVVCAIVSAMPPYWLSTTSRIMRWAPRVSPASTIVRIMSFCWAVKVVPDRLSAVRPVAGFSNALASCIVADSRSVPSAADRFCAATRVRSNTLLPSPSSLRMLWNVSSRPAAEMVASSANVVVFCSCEARLRISSPVTLAWPAFARNAPVMRAMASSSSLNAANTAAPAARSGSVTCVVIVPPKSDIERPMSANLSLNDLALRPAALPRSSRLRWARFMALSSYEPTTSILMAISGSPLARAFQRQRLACRPPCRSA